MDEKLIRQITGAVEAALRGVSAATCCDEPAAEGPPAGERSEPESEPCCSKGPPARVICICL